jgi:hypothetical protein
LVGGTLIDCKDKNLSPEVDFVGSFVWVEAFWQAANTKVVEMAQLFKTN